MTDARIIVRGATTALTRRTVLRKAFIAPWDPLVDEIVLFGLAWAQLRTGVAVHSQSRVINHLHSSVTPSDDNLPEFMKLWHHDVSCALNELLRERRYDAPGAVFDSRPTHVMRLVDAPAQWSQLTYEALNPVAAGLVKRPDDFPMRRVDYTSWKTGYIEVERPLIYFGSDRPKVLRLEVTPPPLLYEAFGGDIDKLVYYMQKSERDGIAELHRHMSWPAMGAQAVQRIHPWDEPRTMREPAGNSAPIYRIGARGILGREMHQKAKHESRTFQEEHRTSVAKRRGGDYEYAFPYGTYGARVYDGAPVVEAPYDEAILTAPGPTLDEVKEKLAREQIGYDAVRGQAHALFDDVAAAFRDETADIIADSIIDMSSRKVVSQSTTRANPNGTRSTAESSSAKVTEELRGPVVVRHQYDKRRAALAPRVITLRDQRLGRAPTPRGNGPHGSDPPG